MDEARLQAYVNLIEQLLTCTDDEELNNILQANQELIDLEFLQVMENYATWLEQQGNHNPAAWLRNMAQQLGQYLNLQARSIEKYQDYFNFLMEVLRKIWNDPSPHLIYPCLAQNLDKLDENFAIVFHDWARQALAKATTEQFYYITRDAFNLSNLIREFRPNNITLKQKNAIKQIAIEGYEIALFNLTFNAFPIEWAKTKQIIASIYLDKITGKKTNDVEQAISCYKETLKVFTEEKFAEDWARTMIGLGLAYTNRTKGNRSENLELAFTYCMEALKVYSFEAFPQEWAMTQNNLGNVYNNRIIGDKTENLEGGITAFTKALKVYTFENFPYEWAMIHNNLANIYFNRIRGNKADNLETAITSLKESLKIWTFDAFPYERSGVLSNLANAYNNRIKGDKAENLEQAIFYYQEALQVRTFEIFSQDWADIQHNLATAYLYRIRGDKAENLEQAISAYKEVLKVRNFDDAPYEWAMTQNNLGNVYFNRIRGDKADNLEMAILAYTEALKVRTFEAFPYEWAMTKHNLSGTYSDRIRGDKTENLENAISFSTEVLKVYTFEDFPENWAATQNTLAIVYIKRIRGERANNLENAIAALNLSLEVYTPMAFPINCLQTGRNLGNTANLIEDWETAIKGYNLAIKAVENIRLQALNPQRKQEILSEAMDVYHGIVQCYLNLNQKDRALEYVERSKTRYLVQLLTERDIYPKGNIPQTIITELDRLRRAIIGEEQRLAIQEQTRNRGVILTLDEQKQPILNDYTHLNQLKQELNQLIDREITPIDPTFSLTQKVESIPLSEIQSLIDQDTAILEWYIAGDSIMAFIVTNEGLIPPNPPSKGLIPPNPPLKGGNSEVKGVKVWQSSAEDRGKLIDFIKDYRDAYENNKTAWINNLNDYLNQLSEILHIDQLLELIPKSCSRLILIPHWFLHIIPLHCLPLKNGQFLYQRFSNGVGYVPSCQLLKLVKLSQRENFTRLFAIKNPTRKDLKPLLGANLEIERISQGFATEKTIIIGELEASEQTLENRRQELQASHCLHFSCHGKFDNKSPRDSALMLADPDGNLGESANLTLAEVFEKFDLRECRLVTFSACESGIIESKTDNISDEYVGLPSGFLFAGSSSVVSTLWTVDPLATTLFMTKFYHDLKRISIRDEGSIAIVLNHTQTWLRTLNSKKLARIKDSQKFQQLLDRVFENKRDRRKFQDLLEAAVKREPYPFANPYYWTAFIATGV
ncbi:MAG: CHAT domain-containing protein [Microcystis aeruginosa Ma_MB_S_20031200_S102]|uniref:CHAT domain-containing protein n=1 Tax=Microcystis aeruginosa Ma_MB_S_20031200_S102 TaxID=2486254 RepID=A0A552ECE8_MICAE|nr:MAG: CHAT domain-containing protein [Microcystis aeruginosa Ma_MB_S_20031200_S102D]TRU32043.1 MAG: CHAT domain-containing protein [Microcystis aeruginosa Ma_MB_S_20031200_S102]